MTSSNNLGIMLGLLIGKPVGILLFCWILLKMKISVLPPDLGWRHLLGAALLAGIGFTMSIFITNLAFTDQGLIQSSKIAVLLASLLASVSGLLVFFLTVRQRN